MLKPNVRVRIKPKRIAGWHWWVGYRGRYGWRTKVGFAVSKPEAIARMNAFLAKKDLGYWEPLTPDAIEETT